jgi:hypothetical protein
MCTIPTMSDSFQVLAFDSIEEEAATSTAELAVSWMISNRYISAIPSKCVYGSEGGLGHSPGKHWQEFVDVAELQSEWDHWGKDHGQSPPDAAETLADFLTLATNGVEAHGRRGVESAMSYAHSETCAVCPSCGNKMCKQVAEISEFAARWQAHELVELECPTCLAKSRLEDWDWQPDWAFAQASITFWNWPPISADAINRLSAALGGIRIRRIEGGL